MSIKNSLSCRLLFVVPVLVVIFVGGCATKSGVPRTFSIDPQTGEITQQGPQKEASDKDKNANDSQPIVHCPDGSLRMGSVGSGNGQNNDDPSKLCD